MSPKIGFVLLTHGVPAQIQRLAWRLGELYPDAPIACHHDFSKSPLDPASLPPGVQLVRPHIVTHWGQLSLVLAFRLALRLLYTSPDAPDWFVFLSGSDYPVRAPEDVVRDLESGGADAYMDHEPVPDQPPSDPNLPATQEEIERREWAFETYRRYVEPPLRLPGFSLARRKFVKIRILQPRWKFIERWLTPFGGRLRCYAGEFWFSANRGAAQALLDESPATRMLDKHFERKHIPEEALNQTILCNQPGLRVSPVTFRYVNWSRGGPHPKFLGMEDLPRIFASGAHFARKFDWETCQPSLDAIDEQVNRSVARTAVG